MAVGLGDPDIQLVSDADLTIRMGSQDSSATVRGLVDQPLEFRPNVPGHSPIDAFQDRIVPPATSRSRQVLSPSRGATNREERPAT